MGVTREGVGYCEDAGLLVVYDDDERRRRGHFECEASLDCRSPLSESTSEPLSSSRSAILASNDATVTPRDSASRHTRVPV